MTDEIRLREMMQALCAELGPDDGLPPAEWNKTDRKHKRSRKTLQLCRQVQRCLELALSDAESELLRRAHIESVEPMLGSKQLRVIVRAEPAALLPLRAATPWLRTLVADAIHRKRVPQLTWEVHP